MKFSEIKHKIKNLGNFKSLEEIKKAGLRIVKNTKTGDYWLIEEEFLKPVIKSPKECKTILIKPEDLKYKVLMVHKSKEELKGKKVLDYIEWGEKQGFHKRPTCKQRNIWYSLPKIPSADIIFPFVVGENLQKFLNPNEVYNLDKTYSIFLKNKNMTLSLWGFLNSTFSYLYYEIFSRAMVGIYDLKTDELENLPVFDISSLLFLNPKMSKIIKKSEDAFKKVKWYIELGFNPNKPIREQEPKPLPDRKALDDIVFDALGLTEEERKEVYWAVAELVQNRLKKAKSV
jgi:nucleoid DNA-binding protein